MLDIQRRVQRKTNRFPPISLPYQVVAEDVLGFLKDSTHARAEEIQRSRVDRIVDELEAHGLIRKVQAQSGFSHLRVKKQVLDALQRDPKGLTRIQTRIIQHLFWQASRGEGPQLPEDLEELADICGLRKTDRLKIVRKAVGALRDRRDLLHFDKTVDIKLGGARIAPRLVSTWAEKSNAVVEVIIALFEARAAAEEDTFDDAQEAEQGEQPDKPAPRTFQITLAALLQKVQSELEEGVRLTAKEALQLLEELRRLKLIGVKVAPAHLTRQLTIFAPELEPDDLRARLEQHRAQTARVFEVLEKLADDERHLRIETDHLAEEVASIDMDVEGTWRAPDGSRLAAGASERLVRRHLRLLTRIKALDISAGLYTKSEAVRVEIARRDPDLGRVTILENADRTIESHAALATAELLRLRAAVGKEKWRWASTAVLVRRRAHIPVVERALVGAGIEVSRDLEGLVPMARVKEAVRVREWLERKERVGRVLLPEDIERVAGWLERHYGSLWARAVAQWLRDYLRDQMDAHEGGLEWSSERSEAAEEQPVEISPRLALEEFVEWAHGWRPEQNGVMVLTAHSSKGLEFDNVVVCDCDWLHGLSITGADRRLFYVAATRARYSLSLTTGGFMAPTRRLISGERSEHLSPLDLEPHRPSLEARAKAPLIPCSVRDVFLSFPAWDGPGCYSDERDRQKTKAVISGLKPSDRILIKKTQSQRDRNPWHVFAPIENGLHRIGKMQRGFSPGVAGEEFYAEVFALVSWRKTDSDEDQHGKIFLDQWFTVIPEWRSIGS